MLGKLAAGEVVIGGVVIGEIVVGKLRGGNDLTPMVNILIFFPYIYDSLFLSLSNPIISHKKTLQSHPLWVTLYIKLYRRS